MACLNRRGGRGPRHTHHSCAARPQPSEVSGQLAEAAIDGSIVRSLQAVIAPPVHSLWLRRKFDQHISTAGQPLPDLLRLDELTVMRRGLAALITEIMAMPAPSQPTTGSIELLNHASTGAQKVSAASAEMPRHPRNLQRFAVQADKAICPVVRLDALSPQTLAVDPPIPRHLADIACSA